MVPLWGQDASLKPLPPIARKLPAPGKPLDALAKQKLQADLKSLQPLWQSVASDPLAADAGVMVKALRYALEFDEFYKPDDVKKATRVLEETKRRLNALKAKKPDWTQASGLVVRGFRSKIDDSFQPYGMVVPEGMKLGSNAPKVPAIVWLHGRGDSETDLHFIDGRMRSAGQITPKSIPVIHVFGRQCIGFKSAGETDVIEAVEHAIHHYPIDPDKVVLMGFSMGGAGAWHLGAHYTNHWVAVSPGAGFAETARYQNLKPEQFPPSYEQTLWRVYDVPNYVRNLFNVPVIAYSGEVDKQIQAARVMEEAFQAEGQKLDHRIGPGMGHKYHPDVLAQLLTDLEQAAMRGNDPLRPVHLQTMTLRYNSARWVQVEQLQQHWQDTRVDATLDGMKQWNMTTKNVVRLTLSPPAGTKRSVVIDGDSVALKPTGATTLVRSSERWQATESALPILVKKPQLQGPIDDAFLEPFVVVTPSGKSKSPLVERWVQFELQHLRDRWKAVFRGDLPEIRDDQINEAIMKSKHLVVFGDLDSNRVLATIQSQAKPKQWPLVWASDQLQLAGQSAAAKDHLPLFIYPNPLSPSKYIVVNSGPTFREAHDRTNSLQNPKLPDWALIGLDVPPGDERAGRIVDAGFFGEDWQPMPR